MWLSDDFGFDGSPGGVIYRAGNGRLLDVEHVKRFQLRVTHLQTGRVSLFDESQILPLMQFSDRREAPFYGAVLRSITAPPIPNSQNAPFKIPGLLTGAYRIDARVQYLPVILQTSRNDFNVPSDRIVSNRINVAGTPWSDWSTPLDYAVLPANENILPWMKSSQTINPRPTFGWGSNTLNAQYEFWVENRVTKERVIHKTLANAPEFTPTADLPAGQYDWWVRIVGTEGARKGWSAKQVLEIFAPAISSTVVAETADATPVVSWTAVTGAQSYVVTLSSTATGKVVYTANAATNTASHRVATTLPNDTYTVSIQALLPNGARTAPGVVDSGGGFVLKRMVVGAAPKNVVFTSSRVSWQTATDATKYDVWINYISPTGKTERIFRQDAFGTDISLPASLTSRAGEYRVWIRAIRSEAGQDYVGRWSDFKRLTVGSSPASLNASALTLVMSDLATTGLQM